MRYYWEVLFSTEYFPYWEFTMLVFLFFIVDNIFHHYSIRKELKKIQTDMKQLRKDSNRV
jgi:type III secretory pathway component EscU